MANLSPQQIEALWGQYGGNVNAAPMAAVIALAESGGNPNATNHNANGSIDRGLFQINSVHGAQSSTDLATNVKAAVALSKNGADWSAWTTYTSGKYKQFIGKVPGAGQSVLESAASTVTAPITAAAGAVSDVGSSVGQIATLLTSGAFWLRIGEGILGLVLLYLGLHALTGQSSTPGQQVKHVTRIVPLPI